MSWRTVLATLLSHWRRHPLQAVAALFGLMVATALWSGVQALNAEARQSYAEAAALLDGERIDRLEPVAEGRLTVELYAALRRAGWAVSPVLEGRVAIAGQRLRVLGVEPLTLPQGPVSGAFGDGPGIGAFTTPPWAMFAAPETLERLGIAPGETGRTAEDRPLPEAVATAELAPGVVVMDIGAATALLDAAPTALLINPAVARPETPWQAVAGGALRLVPAGGESDLDRLTASFHLNLTAFGVLAFCVGLFITHAAVGLATEQRRGTIRTLRACGASGRAVTAALLAEIALAALLAGSLGLVAGYVIAAALLPDVAATLDGLYGADVPGTLTLAPEWWAAGLAISLLGALMAGSAMVLRVRAMPLLASARPEAWHGAQLRSFRLQGAVGAAALLLAIAILRVADSLEAGFLAMAGILIGATLLMPAALAGLLALARRLARRLAWGPEADWAIADARQQISGLGLALMALLLALAANIGVGTMVESFRATFVDWIDQRLFADIYADPRDAQETAAMRAFLERDPDVAELLETRSTEAVIGGAPVRLVGRPVEAGGAYRRSWPLLSAEADAWDRIATGEGAMVSEQLARRLRLGLGDTVRLPAASGPWPLRVVALYADYGNPQGEIGVGLGALEARWQRLEPDGFGVVLAEGRDAGALMARLGARFDLGPEQLIDNAALKGFSIRIFERTFAVTAMLNVLTLAAAGAALFASLATLADQRLAQVAPLWALGVTRRRLAAIDLVKTVGLALLAAGLAIPLGLAVAWLLVAVINVEAFGWRLPLHLFPGQWARLALITAVVAALAAALPALRLARMPPARLVKIFAEERG